MKALALMKAQKAGLSPQNASGNPVFSPPDPEMEVKKQNQNRSISPKQSCKSQGLEGHRAPSVSGLKLEGQGPVKPL